MKETSIRVLIVDDHGIVRHGTQALLGETAGIEVVGEAADGVEAIAQAEALQPDVILMDLVMPRMNGIEAIKHILARQPGVRILALTSFSTDDKLFPAIKAGAMGYFLKDADPHELVQSIRRVARGEPSLPPEIARRVLQELGQPATATPTPEPLTARELDVLRLLAAGKDDREIATHLTVAEATVRTHISNILHKLHLANRVQAALYALREGITSLKPE